MDTTLLVSHVDPDGALPRAALEALGAAKALGLPVTAALFGPSVAKAAAALAGTGVTKVLAVEDAALSEPRYATDAAAAAQLSNEGGPTAVRWYYRQRIEAKLRRKERPWVLLVDPGATAAAQAGGGAPPPVEKVAAQLPAARTQVTGQRSPTSGEQTIRPDAKVLFVAGAGWTKKQPDGKPHPEKAEALILQFVRAAGASLGSSKSLVDQAGEGQKVFEFMTHLNQVGQTGSTPRHPKGLATCCRGEEP